MNIKWHFVPHFQSERIYAKLTRSSTQIQRLHYHVSYGVRHSSGDLSAPTILCTRVQIPSTPSIS